MKKLRLATRPSRLALAQTKIVEDALRRIGYECETVCIETAGDKNRRDPLTAIGGNGLFARGVEQCLLAGEADIAVHSAKDLPAVLMDGLTVAAVPDAADFRDVLLLRGDVPETGAVIGTDSPRRRCEYLRIDPSAQFAHLRGNITTRIEKLRKGEFGGILLAKAGIDRIDIDLSGLRLRTLEPEEMTPAVCQGLLAAECRSGDEETMEILRRISVPEYEQRFRMERSVFSLFGADCSDPAGVYCRLNGDRFTLYASLGNARVRRSGAVSDFETIAQEVCRGLRNGEQADHE